jgi:hypothetical protein
MPIDGEAMEALKKRESESLDAFGRRVERLRISYERFFMGIERVPPHVERQKLERDLRNSPLMRSRNTALRFQFNNVRQRITSYGRYWDRILRMIEEGRFRRERSSLQGTGAPAGVPEQAPVATEGSRKLFDAWQKAHADLGKKSRATYESFTTQIEAQRKRQITSKGWKDVGFDVKVEDGKVRLVGKPLKDGS